MKLERLEIDSGLAVETRAPAVLLLEDHPEIQALVAAMLRIRGATCDVAGSLKEARVLMEKRRYDILFVDVNLPDGSGLSITGARASEGPVTIVMTGRDDIETAVTAIRAGAVDYITKPFTVGDFLGRFDKAREEWEAREKVQSYARAMRTLVRIKSEELTQSSRRLEEICDITVASLGAALNLKDHETADHCTRVSQNSVRLGALLSLPALQLRDLRWGACLHDVGKIGIPEAILLKTGGLTPEERRIMEKHPLMGLTMLQNIEFLSHATDVVLSHHERFDGRGYPRGLRGTEIPVNARIFTILDTLDAMTSRRPYRRPLTLDSAREEIQGLAGKQFDPHVVDIFLSAPASTWLIQEEPAAEITGR